MSVKMTRYKQAEFEDEDSSSVGSGVTIWKTRTRLERMLAATVGVLSVLVIILSIILSHSGRGRQVPQVVHVGTGILAPSVTQPGETHCLSPACVTAAASILTSLEPTTDPCKDFYQFSCGGWVRSNPIPDGKSLWGTFGKLDQQNQLVVRNVLDKPESQMKSKSEVKAKLYYMSCLDSNETIETLGAKPMLELLHDIGGWNISGGFNESTWSLQNTLHKLHNRYNMGGLFVWAVNEDDRGLTLPTRDNYINKTANEKVLTAYIEYMTTVGVLLGGERNNTRMQMQAVLDLETKIAEITVPPEDRRDEEKLYHVMSIGEIDELAPFISWKEYFNDAFRLVNKKISSKESVVVYAPDFLRQLSALVNAYNSTSQGRIILNNYLVWQTTRLMSSYLSKDFRDAYKGLRKALIGSEGGDEPWRYCITDTNTVLGFAIGAMFVRDMFHGEAKPQAEEMINVIRDAFKNNLRNLSFPDYILNSEKLDEKYRDLEVRQDQYFMNNIRVNQFNLKKMLEKLDQPVNKTLWGMTPPTVNAYYTPTKNQIVFPAGILQAPFYDIRNPHSLNFGGMGVVMGHELTHAFDDQGREYNEQGNLHQWWKNETIERFKQQTDCVVKQYSEYTIKGLHVNGKQTLGENIADNGGLKAAYHAYIEWAAAHKEELPLPGLQLTHRQLFFISFAQVWCSSSTDEAMKLQVEKDPHSPSQVRVNGPVSNLPDFSEVFGCPLGSPMNPKQKCEVW
ncbi:hypothetical protein B566_EDAN001258 [Ephemera danica]|nr:hypothetical protein B566_EDAN001258 [Ephemera danica]